MYIIDGHNLLHAITKVDESAESITDIQLCRIISYYLHLTGQKGELVYEPQYEALPKIFVRSPCSKVIITLLVFEILILF